jgi:thioredoxin 1
MNILVTRFSAEWCQPCKMLKPVFQELQKHFAGKNVIFKEVDVDSYRDMAATEGVRSVPTVVMYRDGVEVERFTGVRSKTDYVNAINRLLVYL